MSSFNSFKEKIQNTIAEILNFTSLPWNDVDKETSRNLFILFLIAIVVISFVTTNMRSGILKIILIIVSVIIGLLIFYYGLIYLNFLVETTAPESVKLEKILKQ